MMNPGLVILAAASGVLACPRAFDTPSPGHPIAIPVRDRGDTFFAVPITSSGRALSLYVDSGGGGPFVFADTAKDLGLSGKTATLSFRCDAWIPTNSSFLIAPASMRNGDPVFGATVDGILGGRWLDGKTWTWDYPQHRLLWRAGGDVPKVSPQHVAVLNFQSSGGEHTTGFARIEASIAGQTYSFLLDTGAHTEATASARRSAGFPNSPFAASFIERSIARQWHLQHPDWLYVPGAEAFTNAAMIRVPKVSVGGYAVGPAWFVVRPDPNFSKYMTHYMDAPIVGALGGSVLDRFRVTVDYRSARAYFQTPDGD
jgi:hypothetical protein